MEKVEATDMEQLEAGDIVYSFHFNSYLIIVRVASDDDWSFVIKDKPTRVLKAQTPLSYFVKKGLYKKSRIGEF